VITSTHAIIYADDAEAARAFLRDVVGLGYVDAHDGWLIFKLPPAELGVHPTHPGMPGSRHELYLMCDDIKVTMEELSGKGAQFSGGVTDAGFGLLTSMRIPGGGEIGLYQPRHKTAYEL
jgi:predicted enzyme related to lactoylglutathione lyase